MSDEKKISLDELEDLLEENESQGSRLNFQTIFAMLVLNWQWFLLSLIIFVCGALIYLRYTEPVYQVSARMLIKNQDRKRPNATQMLSNVEDLGFLTNSTGIDNEIEVLQSRVLLRDVVKDLKLYVEYRSEGRVKNPIVYQAQPVNVDLDPIHLDSLDYALLEKTQSLKLKIWRENNAYMVSFTTLVQGKETSTFMRHTKSLPATFTTDLGTVTLTANAGREWQEGNVYLVTVQPPLLVATNYLSRLSISPTSKFTDIAQLTLKDKNYRRGIDVLRQLMVCYNRQANADKNEIALRTEEFINDRMTKINEELGSTESEIQKFKQQNSVTSLADASQSVQMSNEFSARLSEADSKVQMLDYLREYVNNPKNKFELIPSNVGMTDGASIALINSYNQAVQDRNRLLKAASEQAPQVQTMTATIEELQASIKTALLQARRTADIDRQGIQSQFSKYQSRVSAAPVQERVLTQVGRQQDVKSTLYMLLLQKREENSIALAATADNGKLLDDPLFEGKVSPKKAIILLAALVLGFLLPGACIWLISLFRYKIEGHEDLVRLTDLPVIADVAIASEKVKGKAGIVVQANKNNQIDEIFRSMRTNIQFMLKDDEKVILFTSSTSGEGKTFNAANLAVSFALLGKKVILCGLDIRKPALGRLFDISDRTAGITALLTLGKVTPEAIRSQIQPSGVNDNLDLLLAGPTPPNPTELLARDNFAQVAKTLREQYDYVIFDTAPVGLVTDTLQIGQQADLTVFVCRADYTPKSAFGLLNSLAKEQKLPNPCVVLNGIDMSKRKYGYYYGYGAYGKYGRYGYGRYGYGRYGYGNYGNYGSYGQYAESHYGNKDDESIKK
ncbi:MAG: polysaccharide biosynthesis tyrosine autokinase [Bacteroidaceae bacterium]|nr:polysaccharide biosynthesis tyrosine autokinase [Bacteroidaceae bacterium]